MAYVGDKISIFPSETTKSIKYYFQFKERISIARSVSFPKKRRFTFIYNHKYHRLVIYLRQSYLISSPYSRMWKIITFIGLANRSFTSSQLFNWWVSNKIPRKSFITQCSFSIKLYYVVVVGKIWGLKLHPYRS